jgi:RNA polymerase sigma factor (sigma-70 family)
VSRYSAYLLGVIVRIVGDREAAEDLLQEVFVSVWRAAGGFDAQRAQPLTWLTSVARHRAIDGLRRRKADPVVPVSGLGRLDDDDERPDLLESASDESPGPLELMAQAAESQRVQHCLEQLTHEQRQCLSLAYYRGLTHVETAAHLAQPLGTVKSWVRRALLAMRDCLGRAGLTGSW